MSTITIDRISTYDTRQRALGRSQTVRSAATAGRLRLTRRGKVVVTLVAVLAISLLAIVCGPSSVATDSAGAPQETTTVRVLPGHTLWELATEANPNGDIRATVDDIIRLNALPDGAALQLGSQIAVPVYQ